MKDINEPCKPLMDVVLTARASAVEVMHYLFHSQCKKMKPYSWGEQKKESNDEIKHADVQ